ncbi:MAG: acetylxylan esterase [Candidatus Latescibacteria bacterium]|nr:acetylxylan esterase [Candidatus Latescibacterota bacterium]
MSDAFDYRKHIDALYQSVPHEFGFRAESYDEFKTWQIAFRLRLREIMGLPNMETDLRDHQPEARQADATDLGDYVREKWVLTVESDVPLLFWLLKPKEITGNLPLVLTPHGHNRPEIYLGMAQNEQEAAAIAEGDRDIAVQAVREGYIALLPTVRAFGETMYNPKGEPDKIQSCREELLHGLLVGRTAIGERVWDISRLLDWAISRPDVDPTHIAITGNSGGGTISLFAAACDERITVAVPSCYFCTFQGSIGTIEHCHCNYIPGMLRLGEMYDVAGLIAPRPFCAIAGKEDEIFPIASVRKAFGKLREIYKVAGAEDRCELFVGEGGHRYYRQGAWPFIRKWFKVEWSETCRNPKK